MPYLKRDTHSPPTPPNISRKITTSQGYCSNLHISSAGFIISVIGIKLNNHHHINKLLIAWYTLRTAMTHTTSQNNYTLQTQISVLRWYWGIDIPVKVWLVAKSDQRHLLPRIINLFWCDLLTHDTSILKSTPFHNTNMSITVPMPGHDPAQF